VRNKLNHLYDEPSGKLEDWSFAHSKMTGRTFCNLHRNGIASVGQLLNMSFTQLLKTKGFGWVAIKDCLRFIEEELPEEAKGFIFYKSYLDYKVIYHR